MVEVMKVVMEVTEIEEVMVTEGVKMVVLWQGTEFSLLSRQCHLH